MYKHLSNINKSIMKYPSLNRSNSSVGFIHDSTKLSKKNRFGINLSVSPTSQSSQTSVPRTQQTLRINNSQSIQTSSRSQTNSINVGLFNPQLYKNKNVLITGGGTGLGKAMAAQFYELGANVAISSRKLDVLNTTRTEILSKYENRFPEWKNKFVAQEADIRSHDNVLSLRDRLLAEDMMPDIVINNAAANFLGQAEKLSPNAWSIIIDIVLKGTINVTTVFANEMIKANKSGSFINISTTYADTGSAFVVPSGVAKAGCNNLVRSLASEWGKYNLRFVGVAPGPIKTEGAFSRLDPTGEFTEKLAKQLPLGRLPTKDELATFVAYLASDYAAPINGEIINFDGGETRMNGGEFNQLLNLPPDYMKQILSKL